MPKDKARELAERIAKELMTTGWGVEAERLVLIGKNERNLGGWSRLAIEAVVYRELKRQTGGRDD